MVLECLTWIQYIWGQLVGKFIFSEEGVVRLRPLPDDVTINILSRLPADCVLECRRVCRKWRALTSSPYFAELHLKRASTTPSIYLQWSYCPKSIKQLEGINFFIYDNAGRRRRRIVTKAFPSSGKEMFHYGAMILGSCDGLLMFLATIKAPIVFVFNPVTEELITLAAPFTQLTTQCGIYFYPLTREYKLLVCPHKEGNRHRQSYYYTCSLKSKVWKKLDYSSSCRTRGKYPAILLNGSLHWMVNRNEINDNTDDYNRPCTDAIMVFDTETEDFRLLPHPGDACYYRPEEHANMHLLGTRDHLYLCHVSWGEVIHVWVLEDYDGWAWDRKYKINLHWDVKRFPFNYVKDYSHSYNPKSVRVIGILNGELVIYWALRGVFSYNLEQNTVSKVAMKVKGCVNTPYTYGSAYTKSLVSLES